MRSYSKKQLAEIDVNAYCETQKLTIAKDTGTYLRKNLSSNAWIEIAICIFYGSIDICLYLWLLQFKPMLVSTGSHSNIQYPWRFDDSLQTIQGMEGA